MRRIASVFALALVASAAGVVGVTTSAQAAVPSCVTTTIWTSGVWDNARAYNGCNVSPRLYFLWDYAVDGNCVTLAVGASREEGRGRQATFRGLGSC